MALPENAAVVMLGHRLRGHPEIMIYMGESSQPNDNTGGGLGPIKVLRNQWTGIF